MPKGPNGEKRPADTNACAVTVAKIATGEEAEIGEKPTGRRKSGLAGAKARNANLSSAKPLLRRQGGCLSYQGEIVIQVRRWVVSQFEIPWG